MFGLLARKVGMTEVFDEEGNLVPVTVIRVEENTVLGGRTEKANGYKAVVLGAGGVKETRLKKSVRGQFREGISPKKHIKEFRDFSKECKAGDVLGIELFSDCRYIDVSGTSKGKGFQGVMKRWGFGGGRKTHGSKFHREPGSTGQSTYPHHTFKNVKLPGRMGGERVTTLSLRVVKVDLEKRCLLVNGAVPGVKEGLVLVRPAVKKERA